jgi:DNA polymerase III subunit gamma/tau
VDQPLALYRRYRPDTFAQVIGQDHVTDPLRAALRHNRVNHAYLFSGPRGCGKTTSARILARALNCADGPAEDPCGRCDSCVELATGGPGSVDVIEIDAASHGGVDDARELREQATFQPMRDRYKIYIIDEAHMVTTQGFNALLKIVEEPPEHVRFIFATTEPDKVIGTVRSRTHHYPFRLIPPRVLTSYLKQLCEKEEVTVEAAALPLIVRAGGGSARDTLSVLDQLIGGAGPEGVTYGLTAGLLGFTPDSLLDEVVDALAGQDAAAVFGAVDKVMESGQDPRRFTEDLLQRFRDLVIITAVPEASASGLIDVPEDQAERLVAQAARFGRHDLARYAEQVADSLADLKSTTAPRLLLELLCARLLLPGVDGAEGLAARLDRMEKRLAITGAVAEPAASTAASAAPPVSVPQAAPVRPQPESRPAERPAPEAQLTPDSPPAPEPRPAPAAPPAPASAAPAQDSPPPAPGGLGLTDVRRLWPEVVEAVKAKRRVTWIQLSQHAQVVSLDGGTLTLGFNNAGARESFVKGRSDVLVQQVLIDLVGQEWQVEAIVDPAAQPGEAPDRVRKPAVAPDPDPSPGPPPGPPPTAGPSPESAATGPRQPEAPPSWADAEPPEDEEPAAPRRSGRPRPEDDAEAPEPVDPAAQDAAADRDDRTLDAQDTAALLSEQLGAQVIEEIPHR